jgi:hypothetical protein
MERQECAHSVSNNMQWQFLYANCITCDIGTVERFCIRHIRELSAGKTKIAVSVCGVKEHVQPCQLAAARKFVASSLLPSSTCESSFHMKFHLGQDFKILCFWPGWHRPGSACPCGAVFSEGVFKFGAVTGM